MTYKMQTIVQAVIKVLVIITFIAATPVIGADTTLAAGDFSFSTTTGSLTKEGDTGNEIFQVRVLRNGRKDGAVSVDYSIQDLTTTQGEDYQLEPGTLTWLDQDGEPKIIYYTVIDNTIYEGTETFQIELKNPTNGATLGYPRTKWISIHENDPGQDRYV